MGRALPLLWLAAFAVFHVWNFVHYDPLTGYDGQAHLRVLVYYGLWGHAPTSGYATTNPPLYYLLAGALYRLAHDYKAVQALSLALFCCNVAIVKRLLWSATRAPLLRWSALSFIAFLPVHITYAYMVFNYSLAQTEALLAVYCLYSFAQRPRKLALAAAGALTSLGIVTALTNLYLVPLAGISALFFGPAQLKRRWAWALSFVLGVLLTLAPFYAYEQSKHGCFFCTSHRVVAQQPASQLYPRSFYTDVKLSGLREPYFHHVDNSLWNLLYETAFGDYFGYLIPARLSDRAPSHAGLTSSGRHYLDRARQQQLAWLNFIALPIALALSAALARSCFRSLAWLPRMERDRPPLSLLFVLTTGLVFAQFLSYIHRYTSQGHVNVHAGYLLIVFLLGPVELVRWLDEQQSRRLRALVALSFLVYAGAAYWVFLLR